MKLREISVNFMVDCWGSFLSQPTALRSAGGSRGAGRPSVWFVVLAAQNKVNRPRG